MSKDIGWNDARFAEAFGRFAQNLAGAYLQFGLFCHLLLSLLYYDYDVLQIVLLSHTC
jgi:hypothetical protein